MMQTAVGLASTGRAEQDDAIDPVVQHFLKLLPAVWQSGLVGGHCPSLGDLLLVGSSNPTAVSIRCQGFIESFFRSVQSRITRHEHVAKRAVALVPARGNGLDHHRDGDGHGMVAALPYDGSRRLVVGGVVAERHLVLTVGAEGVLPAQAHMVVFGGFVHSIPLLIGRCVWSVRERESSVNP